MDVKIAKEYWGSGLATLPTKADKSPHGKWKQGITDEAMYHQAHGIGIVCGAVSDNLECLDFDNHFGDATETLKAYIEEIKEIYEEYKMPIQSTQSGGYHLLYRCETIEGNQKLAQKPKYVDGRYVPDAIIETRGEGGYFVASPTSGYKVVRNDILTIPKISVEHRNYIIQVARSFNEWVDYKPLHDEHDDRVGDMFNRDGIAEARVCLERNGWENVRGYQWRRSGKKDGNSATFGKVADGVFYVFSSNAYPFEPNKGYKPFQIVALLDYNGDFKAFAKELAAKYDRPKPQKEVKTVEPSDLKAMLTKAKIDFNITVPKPPDAIIIREPRGPQTVDRRLLTLGNFSAITGKAKSRKTVLISLLATAGVSNGIVHGKLMGVLPENKRNVILFDTEQSRYDAWNSANRVNRFIGENRDNYNAFDLREYTPLERCEIIDFALKEMHLTTGLVIIDGIADLAKANNDEEEGTRVSSLLLKWTKLYNLHICNVIHQNKNDNFATGHLGSYVMKKAEVVISVTPNKKTGTSNVDCDLIRGVEPFQPFAIGINGDGMPTILDSFENETEDGLPF